MNYLLNLLGLYIQSDSCYFLIDYCGLNQNLLVRPLKVHPYLNSKFYAQYAVMDCQALVTIIGIGACETVV